MLEAHLLHELISVAAERAADSRALTVAGQHTRYGELALAVQGFAAGLMALRLGRAQRVAICLDKRLETVVASFGAPAAGAVFVPINPLLKPEQVAHILRDCDVTLLVTSSARWALIAPVLLGCPALRHVVLTDPLAGAQAEAAAELQAELSTELPTELPTRRQQGVHCMTWQALLSAPPQTGHRVIDTDMAAIFYTSGSTGKPKGVVLSHRNMVAGAKSVAGYLGNHAGDVLLAALPLSFDAGFSQLSTAFHAGARVVALNYLLPRDVLSTLVKEQVTGLTGVPPLYIQLSQLDWPAAINARLRYFANTGGRMPRETLTLLRRRVPNAQPFLMYGLTEAFRSTFLPPEEVDRRPDSIGKAIPNAEILVLREDGSPCEVDEPGELVHRGALVGLGYWGDAEKTAERYKPLPAGVGGREAGLQLPEMAVFSGDTVRRDAEGFLYFIGRRDEMIKTSGYRVSPIEVEEILYASRLVGECVAFGVDHATLGQVIQVIATAADGSATALDIPALLVQCRQQMPAYMVPAGFEAMAGPLPRNPNGKIDRKLLSTDWLARRDAA